MNIFYFVLEIEHLKHIYSANWSRQYNAKAVHMPHPGIWPNSFPESSFCQKMTGSDKQSKG